MSEPRKPGRAVRKPERFELFEADPTAHLTEEQKKWPVVNLVPRGERFELTGDPVSSPALEVAIETAGEAAESEDRVRRVVAALDNLEQALGGSGLALAARQANATSDLVLLTPRSPAGAAVRLAKLAEAVTLLGLGAARVA